MRVLFAIGLKFALFAAVASAASRSISFANIDGGEHHLSDWTGRPVLAANTASQYGFTDQYAGLRKLCGTYRGQGLVVLAVPSNDLKQELASVGEVKEFCEISSGLDPPMADITLVCGRKAHPFIARSSRKADLNQSGISTNF